MEDHLKFQFYFNFKIAIYINQAVKLFIYHICIQSLDFTLTKLSFKRLKYSKQKFEGGYSVRNRNSWYFNFVFLESDFWTPPPAPPLLSILYMDFNCKRILHVRHVAAALGPLACPSRSARPRKCLNLT